MYDGLEAVIKKAMGFKEEEIWETGPECKTTWHEPEWKWKIRDDYKAFRVVGMFTSLGISAATNHNYEKVETKAGYTEYHETEKWCTINRTGIETFEVSKKSGDGCVDHIPD